MAFLVGTWSPNEKMQFAELPSGEASPLLLVKMEPRNEKPGVKT